MQRSVLYLVLITYLCQFFSRTNAQSVAGMSMGKCPVVNGMENFDINKFKGVWYEVERSFYLMEVASSCTSLNFALSNTGGLDVTIKTLNRWTGSATVSFGKGTPTFEGSPIFKYKVDSKLPSLLHRALPGAGNYVIVHTDYDNYALMLSCSDMGIMHSDQVWVLGRQREIPVSARAKVYNSLNEINMSSDRLTISKNENCTAF